MGGTNARGRTGCRVFIDEYIRHTIHRLSVTCLAIHLLVFSLAHSLVDYANVSLSLSVVWPFLLPSPEQNQLAS